ncbi:MAG: (Fe-S)-binding protein [Geobacteraceae bacterium GWC2_58_44]|nr:MAG: (Fe-S)-binding protein [Geobacteraceae bacterium GWC2_58_44]HBG06396.1 (Fe-S)-binding protein [Geobacter sp.]
MSHHSSNGGYQSLMHRLNKFPHGAPASDLLLKIFSILCSEPEAHLLSQLPLRPFSAAKAARIWKVPEHAARNTLEALASRAMLLDIEREGKTVYFLPPPMAGFFEFSLMRVRTDIDQKELASLFFRYINLEDSFIRDLFAGGATQTGRVLVNEPALSAEASAQVLDYERASEVIRTASDIAVGLCYCRHKMAHLDCACDAPPDNCMTLNAAAQSLIRHGSARGIDRAEGLDILQQARSLNLVQCADNVREEVNFICHCCGCCCEALIATRRLAIPDALYTTNFMAKAGEPPCNGCGNCVRRCPIAAIALVPNGADGQTRKKAEVNEALCLGCGVCVGSCPLAAIKLHARPKRVITPVNSAHRLVLMAIERGKLQNLIFDNQAHLSHRAMAAVLGAILRLPPVKRLMASSQLKSRYLERILAGVDIASFSKFE